MEEKNAIITRIKITNEDHGILSIWIYLDFGNCTQGFGGYSLFKTNSHAKDTKGYTGHFIDRCLSIGGVKCWDDLKGKTIRVRRDKGLIKEIGHIVNNSWFNPSKEFEKGE